MKFRWVKIRGAFVCAKLDLGALRHETYFWQDGRKIFAIRSTEKDWR